LLIAWADSGAPPDDAGWRRALTLPERWQTPSLPISGSDIAALGVLKGPEIGAVLKAVEQHWIGTGFALDRDRRPAKARKLVAAPPEASECRAIHTNPIMVAASAREIGMIAISSSTSQPRIGPVAKRRSVGCKLGRP